MKTQIIAIGLSALFGGINGQIFPTASPTDLTDIASIAESKCSFLNRDQDAFMVVKMQTGIAGVTSTFNFNGARQKCKEFGGDLARIDTQEDFETVQALLNEVDGGNFFWIGVKDVSDGSFNATDPTRFSFVDGVNDNVDFFEDAGELPWDSGFPQNGKKCVAVKKYKADEVWHDKDCSMKIPGYVCRLDCNTCGN